MPRLLLGFQETAEKKKKTKCKDKHAAVNLSTCGGRRKNKFYKRERLRDVFCLCVAFVCLAATSLRPIKIPVSRTVWAPGCRLCQAYRLVGCFLWTRDRFPKYHHDAAKAKANQDPECWLIGRIGQTFRGVASLHVPNLPSQVKGYCFDSSV